MLNLKWLVRFPITSLMGVLTVLFLITGSSLYSEKPTELDQVRDRFADGKVLHAGMIHEFTDSYTGEVELTEGEIWISKAQYKVRADEQVVVVDGLLSRVYNAQQNKLVISEYEPEEDDFAPSRFFSETDEIYQVAEVVRDEQTTSFILHSEDPFELFREVTIVLDRNLVPLEITAVDQMSNRIKTTFTDAGYMEEVGGVFELVYPDDAEIIDLRK